MPIYNRLCLECAHKAELLESVHAEETTKCPLCGKMAFKKEISSTSFRMRGITNDNVDSNYK